MIKYLIALGTSSFLYFYRKKIPYWLNDLFFYVKKKYYDSLSNDLLKIKEYNLDMDNNEILSVIEYKFKNSNYLIVRNKNKIFFPPYSVKYIESVRNDTSLNNMVKSENDLIMANLKYTMINNNNNSNSTYELDVLNLTQQLSGPIGNFYDNTDNKILKNELKTFLKYKFKKYEIKALWIMLSDGSEFNLLK